MRISHSFKKEELSEKIKWFSTLSVSERYKRVVEMGDFIRRMRGKIKYDKGSFKTIQILRQK